MKKKSIMEGGSKKTQGMIRIKRLDESERGE